ncbi:MAG: molybdopterin molybdotransferase, partial [Planctomycetota bacterium]
MSVTIHIPEPLLRYSGGKEHVEVDGVTIRAAFDALFAQHPGLHTRVIDRHAHIMPYLILLHGRRTVARDAWTEIALEDGDQLEIIPAVEGGSGKADVRMRGFRERSTFDSALTAALAGLRPRQELLGFDADLAGRVLAEDVVSTVDVPPFDRAAMDGYALRAEDSFGATTYDPIELKLVGESMPGATELPRVAEGQACRIMTGAPIPPGADAVLMAEDSSEQDGRVQISAAVSPAKHIGCRGEDIRTGGVVLQRGRRLRPQDVGLLASIGHSPTTLFARPRVVILVTGNELLPPGEKPRSGFIVDSNTPMLSALVERDGGELLGVHHLRDDRALIAEFLGSLDCDVLLCAGGSSVGREDYIPQLVAELGKLDVHGVAMRPSAPTG